MIEALPIMELFQLIKKHIRQSRLDSQKCYEHDRKMGVGDQGLRAV